MKRFTITVTLMLLWLLLVSNLKAQERVPGEIIVQLKSGTEINELVKAVKSRHASVELTPAHLLSKSWNIWLLNFNEAFSEGLLKLIRSYPFVEIAQFNHHVSRRSTIPNDTLFGELWNLQNTGQRGGTPGADIDAAQAWDFATGGVTATGDTIVLAVIDGGVDINHQDLNCWKNRAEIPGNGIDDDQNGYIDDFSGWDAHYHSDNIYADFHGTHVAGIAGAVGNNTTGVIGVAWNVQIMALGVLNFVESEVVEDYGYVFEMRKRYNHTHGAEGAFIVATNSSFGIDFGQPADYPLWTAMYDSMGSVGILSAGATVNQSANIDSLGDIPTSCPSPHLITVTNTNHFDHKNVTSGFGATTVDLGAPGTGIYSTTPGNHYSYQSGTSMSTPHVAGAIALMYSAACQDFMQSYQAKPDSMALIIKDFLLRGVDVLPDLQHATVSGGRLNIYNSILLFKNSICTNCMQFDMAVSDVSCNGAGDGSVNVNISQGIPPFNYLWSTGDTTSAISMMKKGDYAVTITDAAGCEKLGFSEIDEPEKLTISLASFPADNGSNGVAFVNHQGGNPPYFNLWSAPANTTNDTIFGLAPGTYYITVTDNNGCQSHGSVDVLKVTGINEAGREMIAVISNPVSDAVHLSIRNYQAGTYQLSVIDISGRFLIKKDLLLEGNEKTEELDVSSLSPGVYLLGILKGNRMLVQKKLVVL